MSDGGEKGGGSMEEENTGESLLKKRMTPRQDEEQEAVQGDERRVTNEQEVANADLVRQTQERVAALRKENTDESNALADRIEGIKETDTGYDEDFARRQQEMPAVKPQVRESALQRALRKRGNRENK